MAITKTSRLTAVNIILSNIGQAPVTVLDSGNPLVEMAELTLGEITKAVLAEGWEYNTERCYPFTPDVSGYIYIPDNVMAIDSRPGNGQQVVIRGGRLYDRVSHSFEFIGEQMLDVTWLFPFEELPEAYKNYITIRAANVFAGRSVGSKEAVQFGQREETVARATMLEYDTQQGNYTIFQDANGGDTYQQRAYRPLGAVLRF